MNPADIHTCMPKVRSMIDMAREAGFMPTILTHWAHELKAFEALVRADERNRTWTQEHWTEYERSIAAVEREACAKVADDSDHVVDGRGYYDQLGDANATARNIAKAIRARGQA